MTETKLPTLSEFFDQRFVPVWIDGGCAGCDAEADRAYKQEFPDGPQPIATFNRDDPNDMAKLKDVFGAESLNKAFGPEGGGVSELLKKLGRKD